MKDVLIDIISERKSSGPFSRDSRENTLDPGWSEGEAASTHARFRPRKGEGETKSRVREGTARNW